MNASQTVEPERLHKMNGALEHRGPDDEGIWHDDRVGFAHRRLSVLDLSTGGKQPMHSQDGQCVVVFNGEIYNFRELRADLEKFGHQFHSECDTEVLLAAYQTWGDDALDHFNGMFAFALYDRDKKRILIARDRLGIKPLYYTHRDNTFAFASELDALAAGGFVQDELSPAALDAYLTYLYIPAPDTIFKNVLKLSPGEKIILEEGRLHKERYWHPNYKTDPNYTLESAAEEYLHLLEDSVRLRQVSDVPLGAFLSGGLDSTSVVATLSQQSTRPVKTFSIGFDDDAADELHFARHAAKHFHTDHTELILKPETLDLLPTLVKHFGEPFADSSALPTWWVSKLAREHVTVALSGDGGDELFAGYTWTHRNRQVARYRQIPAPLRHLAAVALRMTPNSPVAHKLRQFNRDSFRTPSESFRRRQTCFLPEARAALYTPDLTQELLDKTADIFQEHVDKSIGLSEDDQMLYLDTVMYLPDDILTKVDRMSMAHGLEARVPLLDHRLVEFAATVPFHLKLQDGISKRLAKHAVRDFLPQKLLIQRKQGFSIPIHRWFRESLADHCKELVLAPEARCKQYFRQAPIENLIAQHEQGTANHGHHLWALLVLEHWLRNRPSCP